MITSATGATELGQYYALGQDNYYKTIRENGFETYGSGRQTYELENGIKEDHFHGLAGQTWNEDLKKWAGGREIAARDVTVEMPKSISMLYELTDDQNLRTQIREAIEAANKDLLKTIETSGIFRVKIHHSDGTFSYHQAENMVIGIVPMHNTSRAQDPHLHIHNLVANSATIVGDTSGKEYAVDFSELKRNYKFLDNVFHSSLSDRLQRIGINLEMLPKSQHFQIDGITREQELKFSKRQIQVTGNLWQKGIDLETATPAQRVAAWRETRAWKTDVAESTLRARWNQEALSMGLNLSHAYSSTDVPQNKGFSQTAFSIQVRNDYGQIEEHLADLSTAKRHAVVSALEDCANRIGVFKRRDVYREAVETAKTQGHALTLEDFRVYYDQSAPNFDVFVVGSKSAFDDSFIAQKLTTQKFLDAEKSFLEITKEFSEIPCEKALVENAIHKISDWNQSNRLVHGWMLKPEQAAMVETLCGKDHIIWVNGRAGAGKTTALNAVGDIVGRDQIFGIAFQGKASQILQDETGIESSTIQKFLGRIQSGDQTLIEKIRGGVICIDEAGMVGSVDFAAVMDVAKQYDARVWGVGDPDQLAAINAGSSMREAMARGRGKVVELAEVTRQRDLSDRQMVSDIAQHGAVASAVKHFEQKGYVQELSRREDRHAAMIDQFTRIHAEHGQFAQVLTPENKDRVKLNVLAHARLRKEGILKGDDVVFEHFKDGNEKAIGKRKISVGEKIVFLKNSNQRRHGIDVKNGQIGTVTGINHDVLCVQVNADREIFVDTKRYGYVDQAWAISGHKSQGVTEKYVIVEAKGKMMSQNLFYVLVSRFKDQCHVFTDNKVKMIRAAQAKQSKVSALGVSEDLRARATGHKYADAIAQAFLNRETRDVLTRNRIGKALGEGQAKYWHLAPKELRESCNKEFESSRRLFALDLAAAKQGGSESDAVTQRLSKAYENWLENHDKLKDSFHSKVSKLKDISNTDNKISLIDAKITSLSAKYFALHKKNDARLAGIAGEYNPALAARLKSEHALELRKVDADATTIGDKQRRVKGDLDHAPQPLHGPAEQVRQAVVAHRFEAEKIRTEMQASAKRQDRRGREGLSERQKARFKRRFEAADKTLTARIATAVGTDAGSATLARAMEREAKRHGQALAEIKSMRADEAKAKGVKIRDLQRDEVAKHHSALEAAVVAHESRSPASHEVQDLELAHRERVRQLARTRTQAQETAKEQGRELSPEETKYFSFLRNIEEKRFRGELDLVAEKHGLTQEYAFDVRAHYRQQEKDVAELRQAGADRFLIDEKRNESDQKLADIEAADRQRPRILSEIRAAQRELVEERRDLGQAKAGEAERNETVRKEAGELAKAHGNDFYKAPAEERARIIEQYRTIEKERNARLAAAESDIIESRSMEQPVLVRLQDDDPAVVRSTEPTKEKEVETSQKAVLRAETPPGEVELGQKSKNAEMPPQKGHAAAMRMPLPPDFAMQFAEAEVKMQRNAVMARLSAGPGSVPTKADALARAEAEARASKKAMQEARAREMSWIKERVLEDRQKYGPRVAPASDEIIRGTVVDAKLQGGRMTAVVDCGNGRYRVAELSGDTNVVPGQVGELRQQQNGKYAFEASNFQNIKAVDRFNTQKEYLQNSIHEMKMNLSKKLTLGKRIRL